MIQRIQSVYLLLVVVLMAITAFSPLLTVVDASGSENLILYSLGIFLTAINISFPTWGIVSVAGLTALLAFINIFLYKKRKLQIRLGAITAFLILFFYVTLFVYFDAFVVKYNYSYSGIEYGVVLPLIALIFNILAIIKIKKDEKLVRSLDRIR